MNESPQIPQPESTGPEYSALDWPERTGMTAVVLAGLERRERRRSRRRMIGRFAAAGALLVLLVVTAVWTRRFVQPSAPQGRLMVILPEHRTLPDGTFVELKSGAQLDVAFSPIARAVILRRGTANFKVAKDSARPFEVKAGGLRVRDVGTVFSVGVTPRQVEVVVTEGRVVVAEQTAPPRRVTAAPASSATVNVGERMVADTSLAGARPEFKVSAVDPKELETQMNWRIPRLEFSGTPLYRVVALLNRFNTRKLVLGESSLADLQISGSLQADKVQGLLEMLQQSFHIEADLRQPDRIVLHRAPIGS